jgi:GntR family transcriptional regulator
MPDETQKKTFELSGTGPGYTLLLSDLRRRIRAGEWQPGDQIPSERELCEDYGVSRTMVRQTLGIAEREGLLVKVPGRGTFVGRPRIRQELSAMTTFRSTLAAHGLAAERRILHLGWEVPPAEWAERLRLPWAETVFYVEMLGIADAQPIALYQAYTPPAIAQAAGLPDLLERQGVGARSIAEVTAARLGLTGIVADQLYEAVALADADAAQLAAPAGAPAFRVSSVFSAPDDTVLGASIVLYLADRYTFHLTRSVEVGTGSADSGATLSAGSERSPVTGS